MKILIWLDLKMKSIRFLSISDFNLKGISSKLFLKDLKLFMELYSIKLAAIHFFL
jgi:hypothetical protein